MLKQVVIIFAFVFGFFQRCQSLMINTPVNLVQCQVTLLQWNDGTAPYYLFVLPGGQPAAPPLFTFDVQSETQYAWLVNIKGPTPVTLSIKDATGTVAYSDIVTIQSSKDDSCLT